MSFLLRVIDLCGCLRAPSSLVISSPRRVIGFFTGAELDKAAGVYESRNVLAALFFKFEAPGLNNTYTDDLTISFIDCWLLNHKNVIKEFL